LPRPAKRGGQDNAAAPAPERCDACLSEECAMLKTIFAAIAALFILAAPAFAIDAKAVNNVESVALKGFDPVAYFADGKPLKGDPDITSRYEGVVYEFVSKEHKASFDLEPAKYVPRYHGFCAFGVTEGLKIDVDPHAYAINDGKLYVFFSDEARDAYQNDQANMSRQAEAKWPAVQKLTKVIR
jgi:YHS domain-containing protein